MKNLLFVLAAILTLVACSKDDDPQPIPVKQYSFADLQGKWQHQNGQMDYNFVSTTKLMMISANVDTTIKEAIIFDMEFTDNNVRFTTNAPWGQPGVKMIHLCTFETDDDLKLTFEGTTLKEDDPGYWSYYKRVK